MANISAQASVKHTLTQTDITNGFALVHINWPSPFYDTNYTPSFAVEDLDAIVDLSFEVGDIHNMSPDGFDAVVYITAAIPLTQGQLDALNTNLPQDLTFTAPITTLYEITFSLTSLGDGSSGQFCQPWIQFTNPQGGGEAFGTGNLNRVHGNATGVANGSTVAYPIICKGGTVVEVSTTFTETPHDPTVGGFHVNFASRIVQFPNNATIAQVGDQFTVHAMASHR